MTIRDVALAQARAVAIGNHHEHVEPRHVLWGLVRALGPGAPKELTLERMRVLLVPEGTATEPPDISEAAQKILDGVTDQPTALAAVIALAAELLSGVPEPVPDPSSTTTTGARKGSAASLSASTAARGDTTEGVLAELDRLVGLVQVKTSVRRLIAVQSLNAERRAAGLPEVNASHHIVFTGNPGTGKTTVARLIGRLYGTIGVVSKGHLIEATRADLVAGYVGQTALKVQEVVRKAIGGVLFIDEAYSLASDGRWDFGNEAIAMLVQMMEVHRDNLAVIVAGYVDEMRNFIDFNPGLRSRFTNYIDFPDYTIAELIQIFEAMARTAKLTLGPGVNDRLRELFDTAGDVGNFGNARYARTIFEHAYANRASRAMADGKIERDEIEDLAVEDLPGADHHLLTEHRRIGFRPR